MTLASIVQEIIATVEEADRAEPKPLADLRQGRAGAVHFGSARSWFAVWDSVQGILRDFSMHMVLPAVRLYRDPGFPREAVPMMIGGFILPNARFLAQFGFPELVRWAEAMAKADPADEHLDAALAAYGRYANRLHAWIFHYFPWDVADHWTFSEPLHVDKPIAAKPEPKALPSDDLIRINFPGLQLSVRAWLCRDNPEVVADVKAAMPFTTFIDHASVAGESMFAWSPLLSTAPTPLTERVCDAPVGRIRFSQNTGQKFTIQYGETHETIQVAVLGAVIDEDLPILKEIGSKVRHATTVTKELVWMTVTPI
jgi:hypothetical protein